MQVGYVEPVIRGICHWWIGHQAYTTYSYLCRNFTHYRNHDRDFCILHKCYAIVWVHVYGGLTAMRPRLSVTPGV